MDKMQEIFVVSVDFEPVVARYVVVVVGGDAHAFALANRAASPLEAGIKGARQQELGRNIYRYRRALPS